MPATLTCPKCGHLDVQAVGGNYYRCEQCGAQLEVRPVESAEAPTPPADAAYCHHCRAIVLSNAAYCHRCGAEMQTLHVTRACPICNKSIPAASSFCPYCRAQLDLPKEIGCPACGQSLAATAALCPKCGADIEGFLAPLRLQIPIALRPCPSCGQLVPVSSSYCLHCRAQIVLPEEAGRSRQWVDCPACWRTIVPENGRCPYCGWDVEQPADGSRPAMLEAKAQDAGPTARPAGGSGLSIKARIFVVLVMTLLILELAVILALLLMRSGGM